MKLLQLFFMACLLTFPLTANAKNTKNIVILATGGTISGEGSSATGSSYASSKIDIEQIIKQIPGITKLADIKAEQIMQKASQDFNAQDWLFISKKVNEVLADKSVDAVVITHGTDTMEETAYFLNLTVKSEKPVIVVGSMRPSTSLSADGALNLYNAVALAASKDAREKGVLIVMNDEIFAARDAAKGQTTNVSSFRSSNAGAIGSVNYGVVKIYYEPLRKHTKDSKFDVRKMTNLPKVDIIYAYAGSEAAIIDRLVELGSQAIILAGVGDGNIDAESMKHLIEIRKKGIIVVRSSRIDSGGVIPNAEINDDEFGFVTADNLNPQKARVLTMLALTKTKDVEKIRKMFGKY